jgi:HEAT repeat protein
MSVAPVTSQTSVKDEQVRRALTGDRGAFNTLLRQLSSNNPWLQDMITEVIYDCDEPVLWLGLLTGLAVRSWELDGAGAHGLTPEAERRMEEAVIRLFTVDKTETAAGTTGTAPKLAAVREALADPDRRVRGFAAVILARRGDASGLADLQAAATGGAADERRRAVPALGKVDDERAAWILIEVLAGADEELQWAAVQALDELRELALPALLAALAHNQEHVRWHAVRALGTIADPDTARVLARTLADSEYRVRWAAADALVNLGPEAVPAILECLTHLMPVDDSLHAARYALHRIGPHHMQAWLDPLLHALNGSAAPAEAPGVAYRLLREWQNRPGGT